MIIIMKIIIMKIIIKNDSLGLILTTLHYIWLTFLYEIHHINLFAIIYLDFEKFYFYNINFLCLKLNKIITVFYLN